jgi:ABC-type nitrate/sulfonate/bicarbonate transport system permease component
VTFPLYLNVYAGIRGVDSQLIEAGESLGLSRWVSSGTSSCRARCPAR